jgi:hypothetical protein
MAKLPTIGFLGSATLLVESGAIEAIGEFARIARRGGFAVA